MKESNFIILFGNIHHMKKEIKKGHKFFNILINEVVSTTLLDENITNYVVKDLPELLKVIEDIVNQNEIKGIVSFVDRNKGVELAHDLSRKYNLCSGVNSKETIEAFNYKNNTRMLLDKHQLNSVPFLSGDKTTNFTDFLRENKEIIIKPISGQGSQGVRKIKSKESLDKYFQDIEENVKVIAEKYIKGKEYSVESISYKGKHFILGITEKILGDKESTSRFVEQGHLFPANLKFKDEKDISDYVISFLNSSEVVNGPAHTEIKLTNQGPVLIESQLRPGGDLIPKLIELTTGLDIFSLTFDTLTHTFNLPEISYKGEACVRFFIPKIGTVRALSISNELIEDPDVHRLNIRIKPGEIIKEVTHTFDRRYGDILVYSKSKAFEKAHRYCNYINKSISYKI